MLLMAVLSETMVKKRKKRNNGGQKTLKLYIKRAERRKPCQPRSLHQAKLFSKSEVK